MEDILENTLQETLWDKMVKMTSSKSVRQIKNNLKTNSRGEVLSTCDNYLYVLRKDPLLQGIVKYNILSQRMDLVKELWWKKENVTMTNEDLDFIYSYFEKNYSLSSEKMMEKALRIVANSNKYHPMQEYLKHLVWDGKERIRYTLKKYLGADDSDLVYHCFLHFLIGSIKRVFEPGCKYEEMLCLVGSQGAGKSTFFRFLAIKDEWFLDDIKRLDDEKVYSRLQGHWIIEMGEMIGTINAKSNEEIKSFLSRLKDTYRIPYQQYSEDRPRQCVFVGTTNTKRFLPFDRTGSRRFLPIEINENKSEVHILENEKESRAYIEQVWAEAMYIFLSEEYSMKFTEDIQNQLDLYRQNFMQEDTTSGLIQSWLDDYSGKYVCSQMIYKEALKNYDHPPKWATNEICEIMDTKIVGWKEGPTHRFKKEGYGTQRSWIRSDGERDKEFRELTDDEKMELPFD